ncbi:MAG TPA: alkaline phosphatase [Gammaproteobacteria bacterium]|nr:alkaline phosphatase [Gammaproteobacteria bacterium]
MAITRRKFCHLAAGSYLAIPLISQAHGGNDDHSKIDAYPFRHGIASGDPLSDRIILWTRITSPHQIHERIAVKWMIATDPEMATVVADGIAMTDAERDYTVKVDVHSLQPGSTYYYKFHALGYESPPGRTRTLPVGDVERLRIAFTSCSNYPYGYFNVYGMIARRRDLDVVLHLGDYIYEYANGVYGDGTSINRIPEPVHETVTLNDYRQRYAKYRTDANLQAAHRQHAFITVWDDHEFANNAWSGGAQNHNPELGEGGWQARKAAAIKAYLEWMPIRQVDAEHPTRIYRKFQFGNLIDLLMLDTRIYGRDKQPASPEDTATINDPDRSIMGAEQENWLFEQLSDSNARGTRWRFIGQQVMFGQLHTFGKPFNVDQWDGYAANRQRVLDYIDNNAIDNTVILAGDIHSSWAMDITTNPYDPATYDALTGTGSRAVEFVTPPVSSPGIEDPVKAAQMAAFVRSQNPHMKFVELNKRGYVLLDITHERSQAEWYFAETIKAPNLNESFVTAFKTVAGTNHLVKAAGPSQPIAVDDDYFNQDDTEEKEHEMERSAAGEHYAGSASTSLRTPG